MHLLTRRILLASMLPVICLSAFAQKVITGTVRDANGEPMIGVTVLVDGKAGAITDINGNFKIPNATESTNLKITYIGYKDLNVKGGNSSTLNLVMQEDNQALDELVVVGYGTMKKSDLTGSVSSLSTEDVTAKGAATVMEGLQGTVPGVNITKNSSRAGGDFDIEIRGKSSTNSDTKPIYVVDGIICDDINFLNQQDIERIDVLKDASSTAIYGSRATAGVIMVTTKGSLNIGKKMSKPTISYDGYYGVSKVARMPEFQTGQQFYNYRFLKFLSYGQGQTNLANPMYIMGNFDQMALVDGDGNSILKQIIAGGQTTDWADLATRNGTQQNHYVAISGASERVNYHVGLGYNQEKGIYVGDSRDQFSFKGSLDAQINKIISGGFTVNMAYIRNEYANDDAIELAYRLNPFCQPYSTQPDERNGYIYDANGNIPEEGYTGYYYNQYGQIYKNYYPGNSVAMGTASSTGHQFSGQYNPLYLMDVYTHKRQTWRMLGNVYLQIKPIKELTFKTTFSPNFTYYRDGVFTDYVLDYAGATVVGTTDTNGNPVNTASLATSRNIQWTWDNILTFDKVFAKKHAVNLMGLFSMMASDTEATNQAAQGVLDGSLWYNLSSGTIDLTNTNNSFSENSMISYALRANYTFDERYMLTATVRWDGSSKFEPDQRWGCFPSVAVAWRASQEKFLQNVKWLSNLKVRLSYGVTGNNTGVGNYATRTTVAGPVYYPFGSTYVNAFYPSSIVDRFLTWEESKEINFGIDFGFLKNRIFGSVDLYQKTSDDLLYSVELPLEAGTDSDGNPMKLNTNVGSVQNRGIEFAVTAIPVITKDWRWDISLNYARNINKVKEINGSGANLPNDNLFIGCSINNVYGYHWAGIVTDRDMIVPNTEIAVAKGLTPGSTMKEYDYYNICYGLQEGNPIIEDVNGDGTIDDKDKKVYRSDPSWTGSLTTSLSYKNWDLSASLYTKQNYKVYSDFYAQYLDYKDRGWMHLNVDYYIPAGTLIDCDGINPDGTYINPVYQQTTHYGAYPFPNDGNTAGLNGTHAFNRDGSQCQAITDASFVKVKNITLGYTFPKKWINKIGISHLRLYCTVTNPFVWTDYKGFDPEWAGGGAENDGPSTVTWEFGASLKF